MCLFVVVVVKFPTTNAHQHHRRLRCPTSGAQRHTLCGLASIARIVIGYCKCDTCDTQGGTQVINLLKTECDRLHHLVRSSETCNRSVKLLLTVNCCLKYALQPSCGDPILHMHPQKMTCCNGRPSCHRQRHVHQKNRDITKQNQTKQKM